MVSLFSRLPFWAIDRVLEGAGQPIGERVYRGRTYSRHYDAPGHLALYLTISREAHVITRKDHGPSSRYAQLMGVGVHVVRLQLAELERRGVLRTRRTAGGFALQLVEDEADAPPWSFATPELAGSVAVGSERARSLGVSARAASNTKPPEDMKSTTSRGRPTRPEPSMDGPPGSASWLLLSYLCGLDGWDIGEKAARKMMDGRELPYVIAQILYVERRLGDHMDDPRAYLTSAVRQNFAGWGRASAPVELPAVGPGIGHRWPNRNGERGMKRERPARTGLAAMRERMGEQMGAMTAAALKVALKRLTTPELAKLCAAVISEHPDKLAAAKLRARAAELSARGVDPRTDPVWGIELHRALLVPNRGQARPDAPPPRR